MMLFNNKNNKNNKNYYNKYKIIYYFIFLTLLFILLIYSNNKNKILSILEHSSAKKILINKIENNKELLTHSTQDQSKFLANTRNNKPLNEADLIDYFARFFSENNMLVNKIQLFTPQEISGVSALPVKINATGELPELIRFLVYLQKNKKPILVNDFSIQIDTNGAMLLEIQLLIVSIDKIFNS